MPGLLFLSVMAYIYAARPDEASVTVANLAVHGWQGGKCPRNMPMQLRALFACVIGGAEGEGGTAEGAEAAEAAGAD